MTRQGERLAELFERWGRTVQEHEGVYWMSVDRGSRVLIPVLDHADLTFAPEACDDLLLRTRSYVARYPSTTQPGLPGGAYVCTDRSYDLGHLTKRMRNYVRRGLEACTIRLLERNELEEQGLILNQDTDAKHGRWRSEFCDPREWKKTMEAVFATRGAFAIGAFVGEQLASYEVGCVDSGWAYGLLQMSRRDLLDHHPNHALDFTFNQHVFADPAVEGVCIGPVPLRGNAGIHNYKLRMGFEVLPRQTVLRVHPWAAPLANHGLTWRLVRHARRTAALQNRLEGIDILVTGSRISARREARGETFAPLAEQETEA